MSATDGEKHEESKKRIKKTKKHQKTPKNIKNTKKHRTDLINSKGIQIGRMLGI